MSSFLTGIFNDADKVQAASLSLRKKRSEVISSNVANAETPGFRALGYDFEKQLQEAMNLSEMPAMKVTHPKHLRSPLAQADGTVRPEVFIRPTESVGEDGNTVDMDLEMSRLAHNEILYRGAVESLNRKIGIIRYAINGGR